jgi:hypothetical protein
MTVGSVLFFVAWAMMGLAGGRIAAHRGYPPLLGLVLGLTGPLWLTLILLLPRRRHLSRQAYTDSLQGKVTSCATCGQEIYAISRKCPRCSYREAFPQS